MQSSPPVHAWTQARRDSQPESEYSLDLAALDLDGPDDTDTRIPEPKVERIFSEDIDGPSDFTQNMDAWMRGGGTMGRSAMKKTQQQKAAGGTAQTILERNEELKEQEVHADDLSLVSQNGEGDADGDMQSQHTPDHSPPKISVLANSQFEEGFSSEWHTDGEGSPPIPPNHKQFLQPTVEDYYSELSPARQALHHSTRGRSVQNSACSTQKHSPVKNGSRSPGRASSPTLSPARSPMLHVTSTNGTYTRQMEHESRLEMEDRFRQCDAKCAQLKHLNEALSQALDEERRTRKQEKSSHELYAAEAARREQDLVDMKDLAHRHNGEFRREFGQLKEQLLNQQKLTDLARSGEDGKQTSHDAEIEQLRKQLDSQQDEHDKRCKIFEQDFAAVRRGRDQAEKAASDLREELEAERDHHEVERQRFRTELQQAHDDEAAISELERELLQSKSEIENHRSAKIETDDQMKAVREQLTAAKRVHEEDLSRTSSERTRAVELAAGLQRQVQELKQQLRDAQASHEAELERIRSQQMSSSSTSTQELEIVRGQLELKQSEFNMAVIERDEARDTITSLKAETDALQSKLRDMESVNAALDAKVSETIQKRERHWKAKLVESNRERELMARTLMHQWGRQEVGVENPQMYAYKNGGKLSKEEKENSKPRGAS